ncbi:unnamed protein product [Soboliphyme baturini]|uniref:VWFA domain-containing protein n=1 Tax=Soboliphyme baturini TaxID=241478 RepID=A0A183IG55_9BILA|nr:unnamed protein product [Soboliphyme baturini]
MAFESLALLSTALSRLEVGKLAVSKFGSSPELLHPFSEPFTSSAGSLVLDSLTFQQTKTDLIPLLHFASSYFQTSQALFTAPSSGFELPAQLLLIVSDGVGIFSEGINKLKLAVQHAVRSNVFIVFIIIDDASSKNSILNVKVPMFRPGSTDLEIRPYMEFFPFPFYIFLRKISALPAVMAEALRQWFTVITN